MKRKTSSLIPVWSGLAIDQRDLRTHFWYESAQGKKRRLCDDLESSGDVQSLDPATPFLPCKSCQDLYVQDLVMGKRVLEYSPLPATNPSASPIASMVYSNEIGGYPTEYMSNGMLERPAIGMATFARFYDAPASEKVRIVRDARTYWIDPDGYRQRDYYWALRNTLSHTHWNTNDLSDFENAFEEMLSRQVKPDRKENYQEVGQAYLRFWTKQRDAQFFKVPPGSIEIAGLTVLINPEVGMRRPGDVLALKLWLSAPVPKRSFRQAIQYLMSEAQFRGWQKDLTPALWDVRREEIMPPVKVPRDFDLVIKGQAAAFKQQWDDLGVEKT